MKKQLSEKKFKLNTGNNTGEIREAEYCPVHPKLFCKKLECDKCAYLSTYLRPHQWVCSRCVDVYILVSDMKVLPFTSSGSCDVCCRESVARSLLEIKES